MPGEILRAERRRRWSNEEKLLIVTSVGPDGTALGNHTRHPTSRRFKTAHGAILDHRCAETLSCPRHRRNGLSRLGPSIAWGMQAHCELRRDTWQKFLKPRRIKQLHLKTCIIADLLPVGEGLDFLLGLADIGKAGLAEAGVDAEMLIDAFP